MAIKLNLHNKQNFSVSDNKWYLRIVLALCSILWLNITYAPYYADMISKDLVSTPYKSTIISTLAQNSNF